MLQLHKRRFPQVGSWILGRERGGPKSLPGRHNNSFHLKDCIRIVC
jgi:hypothetical protein